MSKFHLLYLELQKKMSALESEITELMTRIQSLESENISLKQENAGLKDRLGLNSTNSSETLVDKLGHKSFFRQRMEKRIK